MLLIGEDMDVVDYKLAKCCTPIPGDDVFGFVTVNEGIKIHRTNCPNAPELLSHHGNRVVKAKWTSQHEVAFLTGLKIRGTDRVGLDQRRYEDYFGGTEGKYEFHVYPYRFRHF